MKRGAVLVALLCCASASGAQSLDREDDSPPTVRPTALLQLDAVASDEDNGAFDPVNMRRARFGLAGELSPSLAYAFNVELGGALGDRYGRRRLFRVGAFAFSVATVGCALAPSLPVLIRGPRHRRSGANWD